MDDEKPVLDYHQPPRRRFPLWAQIIFMILLFLIVALMVWPRNPF